MPLPPNLHEPFGKSVSKSGKSKVIVNIKADPIYLNLDDKAIAEMIVAEAAKGIRDDIEAITESVKPETFARRERNVKQWNEGRISPRLKKRYSGGRIGATPPQVSTKLFQDSGRFAKGLAVNVRKRSTGQTVATVNVPANRLEPESFGGYAMLEANVLARLREHVSWFNPAGLKPGASERLNKVIGRAAQLMLSTSKAEAQAKAIEILKAGKVALSALKTIIDAAD